MQVRQNGRKNMTFTTSSGHDFYAKLKAAQNLLKQNEVLILNKDGDSLIINYDANEKYNFRDNVFLAREDVKYFGRSDYSQVESYTFSYTGSFFLGVDVFGIDNKGNLYIATNVSVRLK